MPQAAEQREGQRHDHRKRRGVGEARPDGRGEATPVARADGAPDHGLGGMGEAVEAVGGGGEEVHQDGVRGEHQLALPRADRGEGQERRLEHQAAQEQVAIDRQQAPEAGDDHDPRPARPATLAPPGAAHDQEPEAQAGILRDDRGGSHAGRGEAQAHTNRTARAALMPLVSSINSNGRRESWRPSSQPSSAMLPSAAGAPNSRIDR